MNGVEVEGFEGLTELIGDMNVTTEDERRAMKKALNPVQNKLERDTPKGYTKKLSKIKVSIKKDGFATVGVVKLGAWWDIFQEFGTSYQKSNVGFFDRSVQETTKEVLKILYDELLNSKCR